jgi:alanine-glyoxylate transaminase/serine-glyoxylate transaminase/serine-pyruvate transaminase
MTVLAALCRPDWKPWASKLLVNADIRLPELTTVHIPDGVNDAAVRGQLLEQFGIEIGGGLGAFKGKLWRVG